MAVAHNVTFAEGSSARLPLLMFNPIIQNFAAMRGPGSAEKKPVSSDESPDPTSSELRVQFRRSPQDV